MVHALRFLLVAVYTVACGAAACLASPFDREGRALVWIARRWVAWIVASCRIEVLPDGLEHVPRDRPCVYMSNHQSVFEASQRVDGNLVDTTAVKYLRTA